jgi:hypothetical protein
VCPVCRHCEAFFAVAISFSLSLPNVHIYCILTNTKSGKEIARPNGFVGQATFRQRGSPKANRDDEKIAIAPPLC